MNTDKTRRSSAAKHVTIWAALLTVLVIASAADIRAPAAQWTARLIMTALFVYGVWILLWLQPFSRR
jgi:hypothetical protein